MKTEFKLTGLSAGNRCTISVDGTDRDWFHAPTNLPQDRFDALFNYFKKGDSNVWRDGAQVIVEHDGFGESGKPINPVVIDVKLN